MKLDSFKEVLLKKSSGNPDLQLFIKSVNEDALSEYVLDLLEKSEDPNSKRHTKPNQVTKAFANGLTDTESQLLYSHLSHHASKYIAASKAFDAETDPQKKSTIKDAANKHAAAFMTSASLAQKISKDAASHEKGTSTNHTDPASTSIKIGVPDISPWQRHANTNRHTEGDNAGNFSSVVPGLSFKGKADFSYLHKKPHPGEKIKPTADDKDGSMRRNSSYPIQNTKIYFKNNETGEKYDHHINIDPDEKFSGKFDPHIMDSHPIFGMHNHDHEDQNNFTVRSGEHNRHPTEIGGFVHTPQSHFPEDDSYIHHYHDLLDKWRENVYEPALEADSYKGSPLFRDLASEKSSETIPLREHTDEEKQAEHNKLINYMTKNPQTAAVILKHHPELVSLARDNMAQQPKSQPNIKGRPSENEEGHISDEHLDDVVQGLKKDPHNAEKFLNENPHYSWIEDLIRPKEGEEGHVPDEHVDSMMESLRKDPESAQKFFEENPHYNWVKRRMGKQSEPQETEQERVQRQLKEINQTYKSFEPKIGIESLLKSISSLLKKNESFFSQNPELFLAVQERFVKAVSAEDEQDQQDEDAQDEDVQDSEMTPEEVPYGKDVIGLDDPETEQDQQEVSEDQPVKKRTAPRYDTNHLPEHGAKYLGLGQNQRGGAEVLHDPDVFSLIRGPAESYLARSSHSKNLENEKNTLKHSAAKIASSEENKAVQSRQDQKNEAWKAFKGSQEYSDILNEHKDNPRKAQAKAELAFNKKWKESGEHGKDVEAHAAASASAAQIHKDAHEKAKLNVQNRQDFLQGKPVKEDDVSDMKLEPDFRFNHVKTVDGEEHHEVSQGAKKHGTVVHNLEDPSKTRFVPGEKSTANSNAVLASFNEEKDLQRFNKELEAFKQKNPTRQQIEQFKEERGIGSSNNEDSIMSTVAPKGYTSVSDIDSEGEAKANIYSSDGDEGSQTDYRQGRSSAEYFKAQLQGQKPEEDKFHFQHNPSVSSGSVAHHDVFTRDQSNQPTKVGTIIHDVKDVGGPKFQPHGESKANSNEVVNAFKSKGVKYTSDQVKSMLNPEQSKRFDLVQGAKSKKGSM